MASYSSPSKFIVEVADHLAHQLNPYEANDVRTVQKGLMLFNQRMVRSVKSAGNFITGTVQDVVPVQVTFDMEDTSYSECSCPHQETCRHIIALFFNIYSKQNSVSHWIDEWRNQEPSFPVLSQKTVPQHSSQNTASNSSVLSFLSQKNWEQTAAVQTKTSEELDTYDRWVNIAENVYQTGFAEKKKVYPFLMNMYSVYTLKQFDNFQPANKELVSLYKIVTNVHLLQKTLDMFINSKYSYQEIEDTCEQFIHTVLHNIESSLLHLPKPMPFAVEPIIEKLQKDTRELLFLDQVFQQEVLAIYWLLWDQLFTAASQREEELKYSADMAKRSDRNSSWKIAYAFQLLFSGHSEKSLEVLKEQDVNYFEHAFRFLDYFSRQKNWEAIENFTPFFLKHAPEYFAKLDYRSSLVHFRLAEAVYYNYAEQFNRFDLYEKVLVGLLPTSKSYLLDLYYENGDYRKLMDFLQLTSTSIEYIDGDILRTIQKEDPESLLPLYHRVIIQAIERKNRPSYREAVRYLKKLKTIYKKLKRETAWEVYFENLLEQTKRLRAFQEECQRGKLIHVENETA